MPLWTCEQCGAQFADSAAPPAACLICEDERQFVNWKGQSWLSRKELNTTTAAAMPVAALTKCKNIRNNWPR